MTKTIPPVRLQSLVGDTDVPRLTESEQSLVLALRVLPAEVRNALCATVLSQADYYRNERRPRLRIVNGGGKPIAGEVKP